MDEAEQIVIFTLNEQRYGVPLGVVERVVSMVEITRLPSGPEFIQGVVNVQGEIMPVLNLRRRFNLTERPIELSDQLIIIRCAARGFALMTERVCEVRHCAKQLQTGAEKIIHDQSYLFAVAKLPDGLILLQDPEALLSSAEALSIDELIASGLP